MKGKQEVKMRQQIEMNMVYSYEWLKKCSCSWTAIGDKCMANNNLNNSVLRHVFLVFILKEESDLAIQRQYKKQFETFFNLSCNHIGGNTWNTIQWCDYFYWQVIVCVQPS